MAVVQLPDRALWVWTPIPLTDRLRRDLDRMGEVRALVAPNHLHDRWMSDWLAVYPEAEVHLGPGMMEKRPDLPQARELSNRAPTLWAGHIDQVVVPGNAFTTEVLFHHKLSKTLLVADLLQNMPAGWFGGWRETVARIDGIVGKEPLVPLKFRLSFIGRKRARRAMMQVLDWRPDQLLLAHGPLVKTGARGLLHRSFRWLLR